MEKTLVINKIKQMPDKLMGIVAAFLDNLMQGYELGIKTGMELSDAEREQILDALAEYEANPETGINWETLKTELLQKHEL